MSVEEDGMTLCDAELASRVASWIKIPDLFWLDWEHADEKTDEIYTCWPANAGMSVRVTAWGRDWALKAIILLKDEHYTVMVHRHKGGWLWYDDQVGAAVATPEDSKERGWRIVQTLWRRRDVVKKVMRRANWPLQPVKRYGKRCSGGPGHAETIVLHQLSGLPHLLKRGP